MTATNTHAGPTAEQRDAQAIAKRRLVGVLGGMGPLATVDFLRKLVTLTPAIGDQEHVPAIVYSIPQIPDRSANIEGSGPSPLPGMLKGIRTLEAAGAEIIAIPCNTAHYWFDALQAGTRAELLHIVDSVFIALERLGIGAGPIGLLATTGVLRGELYARRLGERGYSLLLPDSHCQEHKVMAGIRAIKAGRIAAARPGLKAALAALRASGARAVILGCTEIPLALEGWNGPGDLPVVDATMALASHCIAHSLGSLPVPAPVASPIGPQAGPHHSQGGVL